MLGGELQEKVAARTEKEMLEHFSALGDSLSSIEVSRVVDIGVVANEQLKELGEKVALAKSILLQYAKLNKLKEIEGSKGLAKIGASSTTEQTGTVKDFVEILKTEGKKHLLYDLISVKVGDAKKLLGEEALKTFFKKKTEDYGSVTLKIK